MTGNSNRRRISQLFANLKKRQRGNGDGSGGSSSSDSEEYDALSMNERESQGQGQSLDWIPEAPPYDEDETEEHYQQQHNQREKQQRYGSLRSTSASFDNHNSNHSSMDSLPLPAALRPLVKRLAASDSVTDEEMVSILFIVRLVDALHRVAYATFLTVSFMDELRKKLHVPDLDMEMEVNAVRWSYQQG
jgi:hypothetical protein